MNRIRKGIVVSLLAVGVLIVCILITPCRKVSSEANEPVGHSWGPYMQFLPVNECLRPFCRLHEHHWADARLDIWGIVPLFSPWRFLVLPLYLVPIAGVLWWVASRKRKITSGSS